MSTVGNSLAQAAANPHRGILWHRAIYVEDQPVGVRHVELGRGGAATQINGPWFLWKLLIDSRFQRRGYGREVMRQVVDLVREQGATELLTSYVPSVGSPSAFYARLGLMSGVVDVKRVRLIAASRPA